MRNHPLGIYEKALAKDLSWPERLVLAKSCGFDFVEMSVDETDERLSRLEWTSAQRASLVNAMLESGVAIPSMCLSAHRRFPFGSRDEAVRQRAREIMTKAIRLARDLGIRTIQLAGYDVYYEEHDEGTQQRFAEGLAWAVEQAAAAQVMLAVEIMDTAFMNSISKWKKWDEMLSSPWFTVYPDVGNLSAWGNNVTAELKLGIDRIAAIHLKDTLPVTGDSPGQFRDVPFGEGCVDFVGIFKTLHELNYRGSFLIEMWTEKASEPVLEIIQARRWIESRMQEGGFILPGVNGELLQNQQHDELQRRAALVLFLLVHKLAKKRNQRLRIGNLGMLRHGKMRQPARVAVRRFDLKMEPVKFKIGGKLLNANMAAMRPKQQAFPGFDTENTFFFLNFQAAFFHKYNFPRLQTPGRMTPNAARNK